MGKLDSLKEKISTLREEFRSAFLLFMAILSASSAVAYQVLLKNVPTIFGFLAITGFIACVFIAIFLKKTKDKIDDYTDEMEDL